MHRQSASGVTPLIMAAEEGYANIVELCLESGAGVDCAAADGDTALMSASRFGNVESVAALLRASAAPDLRKHGDNNSSGSTSVHHACKGGHSQVIQLLLEALPPITYHAISPW